MAKTTKDLLQKLIDYTNDVNNNIRTGYYNTQTGLGDLKKALIKSDDATRKKFVQLLQNIQQGTSNDKDLLKVLRDIREQAEKADKKQEQYKAQEDLVTAAYQENLLAGFAADLIFSKRRKKDQDEADKELLNTLNKQKELQETSKEEYKNEINTSKISKEKTNNLLESINDSIKNTKNSFDDILEFINVSIDNNKEGFRNTLDFINLSIESNQDHKESNDKNFNLVKKVIKEEFTNVLEFINLTIDNNKKGFNSIIDSLYRIEKNNTILINNNKQGFDLLVDKISNVQKINNDLIDTNKQGFNLIVDSLYNIEKIKNEKEEKRIEDQLAIEREKEIESDNLLNVNNQLLSENNQLLSENNQLLSNISNKKSETSSETSSLFSGGIPLLGGLGGLFSGISGVGKKSFRFLKGAGRFLGKAFLPITAALSLFDAFKGYKNAADILGKDEKDLTSVDKLKAAGVSVLSGLTFGIFSPKQILDFFGSLKENFIKGFDYLINDILPNLKQTFIDGISYFNTDIWPVLKDIFGVTLPDFFVNDVFPKLKTFFGKSVPDFFTSTILPSLTDLFTKTIPDIFIDVLSGFLNAIKNSTIGKFAGEVLDNATNFLQGKKSEPESTTPVTRTSVEKIPKGSTNIQQNKKLLLKSLGEAGITDPDAIANIFAQVQAESGFVPQTESLNYSAKRLFELYGKGNKPGNKVRFETIEEAQSVVEKGPEAIAETIYGNRMGNLKPGEGFKYRGRGFIQLTGKDNYEKYGKLSGHPEIVNNPDLVNDPEIGLKVAIAFLKDNSRGKDLTNIQTFENIIRYGGGKEDTERRAAYAEQFKKELADMRIPSAELGGVISGPESGYLAQLHGTEAVIPLKDYNVYRKSNDNFNKSLAQNATPTIINNVNNSSTSGGSNPGKSHRGVINTRSSSSSYQRVIFGDFVVV